MQAFAEGKVTLRTIDGGRQHFSPLLCRAHRSRRNDGQASSDYRRLKRSESELQRELQGLRWASVRKGPEQTGLEAALLYEFRRRIVDARNLYLYHEAELAEEAHSLQMQGMSDRKKLIVMMLCAREGVGSIAKRLGITRQAVYRAIQNVPARYQFEDSAQTGPSLVHFN
jgi:transposase-like protein